MPPMLKRNGDFIEVAQFRKNSGRLFWAAFYLAKAITQRKEENMSDIRKFAVEQTSILHLRDANEELMYADGADGQPDTSKPMRIELYGPGSKPFARAQAANSNRMVDKLKKKGKTDQSADEKAAEAAEFLAACTKSMENIDYGELQGDALFKAVYSDQGIGFIAEQVNKFLGDWANFTKASTKN